MAPPYYTDGFMAVDLQLASNVVFWKIPELNGGSNGKKHRWGIVLSCFHVGSFGGLRSKPILFIIESAQPPHRKKTLHTLITIN